MRFRAALAARTKRRLGFAALAAAALAATISAPAAAAPAAAVPARQQAAALPLCAGSFSSFLAPANVTIRRSPAPIGRLDWNFQLHYIAQLAFGSPVTVWISEARVNGSLINSPYQPHTEASWYDFHGSMNNYTYPGSGSRGGTIKTGDVIKFVWSLESKQAVGQQTLECIVPEMGVG